VPAIPESVITACGYGFRPSPSLRLGRNEEPCARCPRRGLDFGGCRCQALALTGDARATDPVCHLAPDHARVAELAAVQTDAAYAYRRM
jgi:hypothetical protein